uniref:Uncharacterized protein n=1 Tax=Bursaphelenchus xylophilus TaxID=6326 RepID=A0A1I7SG18_BURXY
MLFDKQHAKQIPTTCTAPITAEIPPTIAAFVRIHFWTAEMQPVSWNEGVAILAQPAWKCVQQESGTARQSLALFTPQHSSSRCVSSQASATPRDLL